MLRPLSLRPGGGWVPANMEAVRAEVIPPLTSSTRAELILGLASEPLNTQNTLDSNFISLTRKSKFSDFFDDQTKCLMKMLFKKSEAWQLAAVLVYTYQQSFEL